MDGSKLNQIKSSQSSVDTISVVHQFKLMKTFYMGLIFNENIQMSREERKKVSRDTHV